MTKHNLNSSINIRHEMMEMTKQVIRTFVDILNQ